MHRIILILLSAAVLSGCDKQPPRPSFDAIAAERFAKLALDCVGREYPNKIGHVMNSDADALPPRHLTPAFFGCFDWHSSVHGHWLLARLARQFPDAPFAEPARAALATSLTAANIEGELAYIRAEGRNSFERPYGLAWLLQLGTELRQWDDEQARQWSTNLQPLEQAARDSLFEWLPKLVYPIRIGEHSQTAFAFGLVLDWAREADDVALQALLEKKIRDFYYEDRDCPLAYEPSGHDFLSPCIAEADLLRRVLAPAEFAGWLKEFLPTIPRKESAEWLPIGIVSDREDGKLAHIDGLNISRAWMLEGVAAGLPKDDRRLSAINAAALAHREAGLEAVTGEHYAGGHWLGSFATYLATGRGLSEQ